MTSLTPLRRPSALCALLGLGVALCVISVSPALSGCGSSAPAASSAARASAPASGSALPASRMASTLRSAVRRWEGTPYRMGGTTRRGVDCSGFMQRLYHDALGVKLTRSTRTQVREGQRIAKTQLRPGDLIFFRPGRKGRHVGVYVGQGEFAHASTSEGVTITPLASDYWQDAYWMARRVLRMAPAPLAAETPASPPPAQRVPSHVPERTGW